MTRVLFLVLPGVELLDLGGPLQALHEARELGADYQIHCVAPAPEAPCGQGPVLAGLEPLPEPAAGDRVFIPGSSRFARESPAPEVLAWLWRADAAGARFLSICTGAYLLGKAGLLEGRPCTTHWAHVERLQRACPGARVLGNRLFLVDGRITTSAGVVAGVDMTLDLLAREHGPRLAARVARELVVYLRRDGSQGQGSVDLDYRGHLHQGIHELQDWLAAHPCEAQPLAALARRAGMSERSLTRQFRAATGISVHEYQVRLRLERARNLMHDSACTLEAVADQCGLGDARRLRRLWRQVYGGAPSQARRAERLR